MGAAPSPAVAAEFGVRGRAVRLDGGQGDTFRVGALALKRVLDIAEAEWTQRLLHAVEPNGFRIAAPVPAADGRWVHRGWSACRFIDDLRPAAPDWSLIVDAGLRFSDAMERVRTDGESVLAARSHRWAIADRVAWGESEVELPAEPADVLRRLGDVADAEADDRQFVHGDLSGNVFLDRHDIPVILDVSPYLRPREWSAAVVAVDAVLWYDAPIAVAREFLRRTRRHDLLARALMFRLVADFLPGVPGHPPLEPYVRVFTALG